MKQIKLVLFKEVGKGDLRKLAAKAADATTGRGARDLRFPHDAFDPIFARLLPTTVRLPAGRKKDTEVNVRTGSIQWHRDGGEHSVQVEYWPPNNARPTEGRWAKVNTIPYFASTPLDEEDRIILLLIQDEDDVVWLHTTTAESLKTKDWNQEVALKILGCAGGSGARLAQGYIDFQTGKDYCHGE